MLILGFGGDRYIGPGGVAAAPAYIPPTAPPARAADGPATGSAGTAERLAPPLGTPSRTSITGAAARDRGGASHFSARKPFSMKTPSALKRRRYVSSSATTLPIAVAAATMSITTIW